jgi:hypothetical protein
MTRLITDWPHKNMMKCAACGHVSSHGYSDYPPEGTPPEKIHIQLGTRSASMYCSNPDCHCYTIYVPTSSAVERLTEKYKPKKP